MNPVLKLVLDLLTKRPPDQIIGEDNNPYMWRWWLVPRNKFFNVYLHRFFRSDDDRALHDHPWCSMSLILHGGYWEHFPIHDEKRSTYTLERKPFRPVFRGAEQAHRIELFKQEDWVVSMEGYDIYCGESEKECWSLFLTGPKVRSWGFHCKSGWVYWREYTDGNAEGVSHVGKGCGDE